MAMLETLETRRSAVITAPRPRRQPSLIVIESHESAKKFPKSLARNGIDSKARRGEAALNSPR
jgi:hypothetical protein